MVSAVLTMDYFLLTIFLFVSRRKDTIKKYNKWFLVLIFVFPCYNFALYSSFEKCGVNDFLFYCGICNENVSTWKLIIVEINYNLPVALGLIVFICILCFNCRKYKSFN